MCNCCVFVLPTLNPAPCTMYIIEFDIKIIILGKFSAEVSKICAAQIQCGKCSCVRAWPNNDSNGRMEIQLQC